MSATLDRSANWGSSRDGSAAALAMPGSAEPASSLKWLFFGEKLMGLLLARKLQRPRGHPSWSSFWRPDDPMPWRPQMRTTTRLAALLRQLTLCMAIALWSGQAAAQICEKGVSVRVNGDGLAFVAQQLRSHIPQRLTLPDANVVVADWWLTDSDARVIANGLPADLTIHDLRVYMQQSVLHVAIALDANVAGPIRVINPYVGFGQMDCTVTANLRKLRVDVGAEIRTGGGQIDVDVTQVSLEVDSGSSSTDVSGCALGEAVHAVLSLMSESVVAGLETTLRDVANAQLADALRARLAEVLDRSGNLGGVAYRARLDGLQTDAHGLQATLAGQLDFVADDWFPPCPIDETIAVVNECGREPQIDPDGPAMFGVGLSQGMLNRALDSLWRRGGFCVDSERLRRQSLFDFGQVDKLTGSLGQDTGNLRFRLQVHQPPRMHLDSQAGALLQFRDVRLDLAVSSNDAEAIVADFNVLARPSIAPISGAIALDLREVSVKRLGVLGAADNPNFQLDLARVERFLRLVAVPILRSRLAATQLTPSVIGLQGYLLEMVQLRVNDGFTSAFINAHRPDAAAVDQQAPETQLVAAPTPMVGPQVVTIDVVGSDNQTPVALLRYRHRLDGGAWSDPVYSRRVDVVADAGIHRVEIASVDQNGNVDSTPVQVQFQVDDSLPELQVREPDALIDDGKVEVGFSARDAITPPERLEYMVELLVLPEGGDRAAESLETREYRRGVNRAEFEVSDNGTYRIRITVRDEAGNVTSRDIGFVNHFSGCRVAGGGSPQPAVVLFLLYLAAAVRRRRS